MVMVMYTILFGKMPITDINTIWEACADLDEVLADQTKDKHQAIRQHLELIDKKFKFIIPDFKEGLEWLNTKTALSFKDSLKGKIVILDFFTYCCVNCLHVLPDLEALEEKFSVEDGVVIVGVHSAKFENEKVSANILSAVLRYNIHHPVVNDCGASLWTKLQISCWPTFVIVGPEGQFLHHLIGEGHRQELLDFVNVAKDFYEAKGALSAHSLSIKREKSPETPLLFPGKVCVSQDGHTVVVADTGHHRILVTDDKGVVKNIIGSSSKGFKDGSFSEAEFHSPQGVALGGACVYVADTENHTIRKADLETGLVETLAGTGCMGDDKEGGKAGTQQELSSPWDVCLDGDKNEVLFIAMAGTHQIWAYFLKDSTSFKTTNYVAGTCLRFAGSGLEENRNNSYLEKASFAQPSGLAVSRSLNYLFVADSESSSIRSIQLNNGPVKNVVGGDIDPRNLFAYGDVDDTGTKAKLQHPLGVAMATEDGPLLVADSYNHKIKTVDIATRTCKTLLGTGKPGVNKEDNLLFTELNEPGGVCADKKNKRVYIADTNNHDIKVLELESENLYRLPFIFPAKSASEFPVTKLSMAFSPQGTAVKLQLQMAPGVHLNEEAPNTWTLYSQDEQVQQHLKASGCKLTGDLSDNPTQTLTNVTKPEGGAGSPTLSLKLDLFVCEDSGVCRMDKKVLTASFDKDDALHDIIFNLKLE